MADASAGGGNQLISPALVGRRAELDRLVAAVTGPPALVVVDGEAGIGKTRLVTELAAAVAPAGIRALTGRCQWIRESFPLGPVIEALRGRAGDLDGAALSAVSGALRPLLPELSDVLPAAPEPLDDRAAERHRVFRGLVEIIGALSPAVLVLEDLHWADEQTGDLVGYLLAESLPEVSVVVTYRGESVDPAIRAAVSKAPPGTRRTDIALHPLDADETGALAASIMGVEQVSHEFASYLCERTSGLPFAIEELLALLRARGTLVQRGGGWARRALDELDVPTRIRDSVLERVARLDDNTGRIIEAAAVLQVPVVLPVLVETSLSGGDAALSAVAAGLESGLLAEVGGGIGFRHPLAAQAVYDAMPGPRQILLHRRAASALRAIDPMPLGQVAHHLRYSGRLAEWVEAAEHAADHAIELRNDAEAVRLLEDVLRHGPAEPEKRGRIAVKLGQAAIEALRADDVTELLADVLDEDLPAALRGELRFRLGGILHDAGTELQRAHQLFVDAVDDLDHRPDLKAWAMVILGIPMAGESSVAEHRRWLQRALTVVPDIADPAFQVFLLGKIAMVQIPTGDRTWREQADTIITRTGGRPRHRREINAYWSVGTQACFAGHHQAAEQMLTAGLSGAAGDDGARTEARLERSLRSVLALLRYCQGSWDGLAAEAAVLIEELAGHPRARIDAETVAACLALARGDLDNAHRSLTDVVALVDDLGAFDILPIPATALLRLAVARGEAESAVALVERLRHAVEPMGVWAPAVRALPASTEALVTAGQVHEADDLLARYARDLAELDAPLAAAALEHAHGFVQLGHARPERAAAHFASAALLYEPLRCPYEAALARESAAVATLDSADDGGSQPDPRPVLLTALATYRQLGATWDIGRVTQIARRHGVPVPARHRGGRRGYGSELSPREREVAELAAMGRSNKEIAAELYLSVNTVARHITAAMRKLDIRSRAAIAHRLIDLGEDDAPSKIGGNVS